MARRRLASALVVALVAVVAGMALAFLVQRTRPRLPEPVAPAESAAPASEQRASEAPGTASSPPPPTSGPASGESGLASEETGEGSLPEAAGASELIPLEKLLSWEDPGAPYRIPPVPAGESPPARSPSEVRLRLERLEGAPPLGSRRDTRTELDLSVPLDDARTLRLRGGVRVDAEEGGPGEERQETRPTVGLEKRF